MNSTTFKQYLPTVFGHLAVVLVYVASLAYSVGRLEAVLDARIMAVDRQDTVHHQIAMDATSSLARERDLKLAPVEARLQHIEQLSDVINRMASDVSAMRVEQTATNRRIDELKEQIKK